MKNADLILAAAFQSVAGPPRRPMTVTVPAIDEHDLDRWDSESPVQAGHPGAQGRIHGEVDFKDALDRARTSREANA